MGKLTNLAIALFILCHCPALRAQDNGRAPDLGRNAALLYWRAFAVVPEMTKEQDKLLDSPTTTALDERVEALLRQWETALNLLHAGTQIPACDWGIDWRSEGPGAVLPHLSKARQLARVACLRARMALADGDVDPAAADLAATATLAQHVGAESANALIGELVKAAIEGLVAGTVSRHLMEMPPDVAARLRERIIPRARHGSMRPAILVERQVFMPTVKRVVAQVMGEDRNLADALCELGIQLSEDVKKQLGGSVARTPEQLTAMVAELERFYDELLNVAELPIREFPPAADAFQAKVKASGNILATSLLPALTNARYALAKAEVQWAMLDTALDIRARGQKALADSRDPWSGRPFSHHEIPGGFELRSAMQHRGKPVALRVEP